MDWQECVSFGDVAQIGCLEPLFASIVGIAAALAGLLFFIMLLVGGFKYLFAGGNPKAVESARGTLTAAALGLVLIISSYVILRILEAFTGLNLSTFRIETF